MNSKQVMILPETKTNILTDQGQLAFSGYSLDRSKFVFDSSLVNPSTSPISLLNTFRVKKWETYIFTSKDYIIGIGTFDLGYIGGMFFHMAQLNDSSEVTLIEDRTPLKIPKIKDNCPDNCLSNRFVPNEDTGAAVIVQKHNRKHRFQANLLEAALHINGDVLPSSEESLILLLPVSNDWTLFDFNELQYNMKFDGSLIVNDKKFDVSSFQVTYCSSRGVWPVKSGWTWTSASGLTEDGQTFGFTSTKGVADESSLVTEDAFFIEGKIYKLNAVKTEEIDGFINFSSSASETLENYCEIAFKEVKSKRHYDYFFSSEAETFIKYGYFTGKCFSKESEFVLNNVAGFVEVKKSIW